MNSKQLPLYYHQEIVRLSDQATVAHELLLRSAKGLTLNEFVNNPSLFIEHHNFLMEGKLRAARYLLSKNEYRKLFINLTPEQIASSKFLERLEWLSIQGINLSQIVIEVTEGSNLGSNSAFVGNISSAKSQGALIAIDDFGNGYSNMFCVPKVQPDIVKLDINLWKLAFSKCADEKIAGQRLVLAAVKFIKGIGAKAVIEGIETKEQSYFAIVSGADFGQGYYYHRPERAVPKDTTLQNTENRGERFCLQVT